MVVIDDMDSINEPSQQVFRNYIDKYKNNVNFVSVCSNVNKIIDSIQSRVHILKLESLSGVQTEIIMNRIIEQESIHIDPDAQRYLLRISGNTIRNVINNLEKLYIYGSSASAPVTLDMCKRLCSTISFDKFELYIDSFNGPLIDSIGILYEIHDYGYSVIDILDYFFAFVKDTDRLTESQKYLSITVICKYITIFHKIHEDVIELALFTNDLRRALR
jgi:DNA polymerase III delta prime subunit